MIRPVASAFRRKTTLIVAALFAASCSRGEEPDAYGNVETTQVTVSAEAAGRLVAFDVHEGQTLAAAATVGRSLPTVVERADGAQPCLLVRTGSASRNEACPVQRAYTPPA